MKSLLTILLITGYVAIGVFGIFGMHAQAADMEMSGHEMSKTGCVGATAKGADCPKQVGAIDFTVFHIEAFKGFSLATLAESIMATLLLAFALTLFIRLAFFWFHLFKSFRPDLYRHRFRDSFFPLQQQKLTWWLALHENSPATV